MGVKYFRNSVGEYVGAFDGIEPPAGLIEVTVPPTFPFAIWNGESWEAAPPTIGDHLSAIAARRYEAETSGTTVDGIPVNTERDSQALLTGAALQAMLDPNYTVRWKTEGGFVDLDAQQIIGLASAVRAHVQACFDREAELVAALDSGAYTESMLDDGWP